MGFPANFSHSISCFHRSNNTDETMYKVYSNGHSVVNSDQYCTQAQANLGQTYISVLLWFSLFTGLAIKLSGKKDKSEFEVMGTGAALLSGVLLIPLFITPITSFLIFHLITVIKIVCSLIAAIIFLILWWKGMGIFRNQTLKKKWTTIKSHFDIETRLKARKEVLNAEIAAGEKRLLELRADPLFVAAEKEVDALLQS